MPTLRGVMHRAPSPLAVALNACLLAAQVATAVQLLPAGTFAARDGRPGPGRQWKLPDDAGRALAARLNERKTPLLIDYEHQTLAAEANGQPAPAAGWASAFEWRDGAGLFARVEWTARARQMIEAGEYRFISPVFTSRKADDGVVELLHAALVNNPALDGMADVAERIAARFAAASLETPTMNPLLQKLLAAVGLKDDATEETALTAVAALKANADEVEVVRQELTAAEGEVSALKAKGATPDSATLSAMKTLQDEVSALRSAAATRELDEVVTTALKAGRLLPAQEKWARDLGTKDLAALKGYLDTAPAVQALAGQQSGGRSAAPAGGDAQAIALKAQAYIDEQAKAGRLVTSADAVRHVQSA